MRRSHFIASLAAQSAASTLAGGAAEGAADLIVVGATVRTGDPRREEAQGLAISGGHFAYVGTEAQARALAGPQTRVLDVEGATVYPGFVDAHVHLSSIGLALREVRLHGIASYAAVVDATVAFARTNDDPWIVGVGWDQNLWPGQAFPTEGPLSAAWAARPVVLHRIDGHASLANAEAMRRAGITAQTPDPAGGRIVRDEHGAPTGLFIDNAALLIVAAIPPPSAAQLRTALGTAIRECHRWGITSVGEARTEAAVLAVLESLAASGALDLRVHAMLNGADDALLGERFARGPRTFDGDARLAVRAVKLYADGALGSRGAALLAPYSDDPHNSGLLLTTQEHRIDVGTRALKAGFQVCTHAIGDRANRLVLDAYEQVLHGLSLDDARARRFRVEHAQILAPEDLPRFAALGIIPSMQTTHQVSDMPWAQERLGAARLTGAYAWRSLLDTGVIIANGTDAPVESLDTVRSFHAAVTRQDERGAPPDGWYPDQRMTRVQALKSMTLWAAQANFAEHLVGSIARGKFADFVVADGDLFTAPAGEIMQTKIRATYLAGRKVYDAATDGAAAKAALRPGGGGCGCPSA